MIETAETVENKDDIAYIAKRLRAFFMLKKRPLKIRYYKSWTCARIELQEPWPKVEGYLAYLAEKFGVVIEEARGIDTRWLVFTKDEYASRIAFRLNVSYSPYALDYEKLKRWGV